MSIRSYIALTLALVLILTDAAMALARTAPGPAGSMVLCTGTGPVTVLTDVNGAPMGGDHICPDCQMGLFEAALPGLPDLPRHLSHPCKVRPAAPQIMPETLGLFFSRGRVPPAQD